MNVRTVEESAVNERGGQRSYLLLGAGDFGSRNLAITWVEGGAGSEQPMHAHDDNEQAYVIVRGRGLMRVGDETREFGPGTLVFVPPATPHAIRSIGEEPLVWVSATSPPFDTAALDATFAYRAR